MMKFINRERELQALEKFWRERGAQLIVIYGKRRIGKTELMKQFIRGKPHVYFLAQIINEHENFKLLGEAVGEFFGDEILRRRGFDSWEEFFEYIRNRARERVIIAVDEFPYLVEANRGIPSIFQKGWDEYLKESPVFLILCGSSVAMMEEKVLSYKAALYGRRTGQILLLPFRFSDVRKFYPSLTFERRLELYSIAGGNPSYLIKLSEDLSLDRNIEQRVLQPETFLYNEVEFILREELRKPRNYMAILRAIALSKNKLSEIVNETGLQKGVLHKYLFTLEDLHLVKKEVPVTEKNPLKSRKGIYILQDPFFKFWFRYVLPNRGHIEEGKIDHVLNKIKKDFTALVAENYEKVAQEILRGYEKRFFPVVKIGRWWHKNEEIDIVALNEETKEILYGEVKWSKRPVGTNIYDDLKKKAQKVVWNKDNRKEYFCLFSKSGFTQGMLKQAKKEKVALFHKDKLIN